MKTGPPRAAFLARPVSWLNSRLDSLVIVIAPPPDVAMLLSGRGRGNHRTARGGGEVVARPGNRGAGRCVRIRMRFRIALVTVLMLAVAGCAGEGPKEANNAGN